MRDGRALPPFEPGADSPSHEPQGRAGCAQPAAFRSGCERINELGNRFEAVPANLSANHSSV